jgi:hypothetical protein
MLMLPGPKPCRLTWTDIRMSGGTAKGARNSRRAVRGGFNQSTVSFANVYPPGRRYAQTLPHEALVM